MENQRKKMSLDFADTCFWIALASPKDELHNKAVELSKKHIKLLTTQEVLSEFLNFFSSKGTTFRSKAVEMVSAIQSDPNITIVKQTPESFNKGLELYKTRSDKQYSMPDCISMVTMKERKMSYALTNDHHFSQEGFKILF